MKKLFSLLMAFAMLAVLLTGCGGDDAPGAPGAPAAPDAPKPTVVVNGQPYDTGEFRALVPDGWAAFPITDVFSEDNAADPTCFTIIKGGTSDLDVFYKPYLRLDYYGPDLMMMEPSSEWYENVKDVAPMQLGGHTWSGFTAEDGYGEMAILWTEKTDVQYQASIWLTVEDRSISLEDADVQAILASVERTDAAESSGAAPGAAPVPAGSYDWWENEWYGWWAIKNGTGVYREPSEMNLVWDTFAEIDVYNDNTGRVTIWDTGTSRNEPMIIAYDVSFEPGLSNRGCLISKRVDFFPYGCWNNGMQADLMSERETGWIIDPAISSVSHFDEMLEITGHYASPDNPDDSFDYYIYLRPWGRLWDDVRTGDTSGCLYRDMMPLYHDNWYVSLLNLGYEHPTATFQEGIDIINAYLAETENGGAAGLGDKAGADGRVSMAKLKEMLPWCKTETSYSMTYDEIAAQFGVHGKQIESLFENTTIYRWSASESDYIQLSFDVHPDGSETWNVTQWNGID